MTAQPHAYTTTSFYGRYRLIVAIVVPVLTLIAFSAWVVNEKMDAYRQSADLLVAAQVARAAQSLSRELENERVLSTRLADSGDPQTRIQLEAQRLNTDERLRALRATLAAVNNAETLDANNALITPGVLTTLRDAVDHAATAGAVSSGYSRAIASLTSLSALLTPSDLSRVVSAFLDLGNLTDRLGRARVLLSNPDGKTELNRQALIENAAETRAHLQSFRTHASAQQLKILDEVVQGPPVAEVERLHQQASAGLLSAKDRQLWDDAHVALMKLYSQAQDRMTQDMDKAIQENLKNTRFTFFLVVMGVVVLVGLSLESLRRSERRAVLWEEEARKLFRAVEQSPVSVLISNADGMIEYINPAFSAMTGYQRDEVLGRSPRLLRSEQTPGEVFRDMWTAIRAGQDWRGEIVNQRKDGSVYWESMTVAAVRDADGHVDNFIAFKEDVTEIRNLRLALELEHSNLRRIFASTKDLIALIDCFGNFEYANPALEEAFGPVLGARATDYFLPPIPQLIDGSLSNRGDWVSDLNGKTYEITITSVDTAHGRPSALLALHDITTRKQAEIAMAEAREAAELSNRAKTEFLATMSHELRTPLNAIIGFSEIIEHQLLGPIDTPQYRDYAHDINQSGRHLLNLITDILDVARLEVGRFALTEAELDVAQCVRASVQLVSERAKAAGLVIHEHVAADLPPLYGDERRIKQTIANILANAVKFTAGGGLVTISASADVGGLDIVVTDNGIGIHPNDITKIMAPFGQAESTLARRFDGAGLGLPLARRFMDMHDGHLYIASEPGRGTKVTLHFPSSRLRRQETEKPHRTDC